MPALKTHSLTEVLEDRVTANSNLSAPFDAVSSFVSDVPLPGMPEHIAILNKLTDELVTDFGIAE
jgi:hypothetical protein